MKTTNPRSDIPPKSVPELIKKLWNLYFEMSLDPELEVSAEHIRSAALSLEHTRKIAFEVMKERESVCLDDLDESTQAATDEDELLDLMNKPKFGSTLKH